MAVKATDGRELRFADVEAGFTLLGLFGLIDPPREEAVSAVAQCQSAGIRVKMITGDHGGTARAIARQLGLVNDSDVLTGAEIDRMDDAALAERAPEVDVFARTSPEHKLRLVRAIQAKGHVIAMTGDGVNDAPAIKQPTSAWLWPQWYRGRQGSSGNGARGRQFRLDCGGGKAAQQSGWRP